MLALQKDSSTWAVIHKRQSSAQTTAATGAMTARQQSIRQPVSVRRDREILGVITTAWEIVRRVRVLIRIVRCQRVKGRGT
jgi:hypothetical protein